MIEIIPAIDLREGKCVRLFKGAIGTETCYYENPVDALTHWKDAGATRIHIVDLDAATGIGSNKDIIERLVSFAGKDISIQVGGGIRDESIANAYIDIGVSKIVIGTAAVQDPRLIEKLSRRHGSGKIIVALDHKDGMVQVKGWTEDSGKNVYDMARSMENHGAGAILFSSVEADGAFTGPDLKGTRIMVNTISIPVIAAGGVRNLGDVASLNDAGAAGVIIGKALYEGKIDLPSAFRLFSPGTKKK
ncbi:1-(5-phosphoribosyl)-5-[(5-phosphoribosylamino)methylideneamino]imidazole-4-carboxamide isomerase [Candidatus Bathyarchaeota archaeon]|nr:1-(5-phosphoribosyl)-5-[(5-phosphoribosylamino)methylideneamino]imidazole-4-carboxamide isomerase [Candidatus Bathyarchaeota archaeon]